MRYKPIPKELVLAETTKLLPEGEPHVISDTTLIGSTRAIDSIKLAQLRVNLESLAIELGFASDWKPQDAMCRSRSMFRSAGDLAMEFSRQMDQSN